MGDSVMVRRPRLRRAAAVLTAGLAAAVACFAPAPAVAQDSGTSGAEQELAERYVPVMMLKTQDAECDPDGEPYLPTAVDIVLDNPQVVLRQVGIDDPVITGAPSAADLHALGDGFHLDFPGLALEPGCTYQMDFDRYAAETPPTVYAHVVEQDGKVVLQYWFYWYYNDWNNKHESDWEGIQLVFPAATVEEALTVEPESTGYAQHEGGERAGWDASKLEKDGQRPVVYSSSGSHASYYSSAVYIGRSASEGFGCDDTDGPSTRIDPVVVVLPDSVDDAEDPLAWVAFEGRWGERHNGPYNGPTGPATKDRWTDPLEWQEDLRGSSVVVPTGDSSGAAVVDAFCDVVEWGSVQFIELKISPWRGVVALLVVFLLSRWLVRRTRWTKVATLPIRMRRRAGELIRAAPRLYGERPLAFMWVGLWYIPLAAVAGAVAALLQLLPLIGDFTDLGADGGTNVGVALFVGGLTHLFGYVVINAAVAHLMAQAESSGRSRGRGAYAAVLSRAWDLLTGLLRAIVIVGLLLASVVGIPWGIRQLVRYQFLSQSVMLDGCDGREALRRSSDVVRGRWWYMALMVALLTLIVEFSGLVVGLLLLVIFTGVPLWVFSVLVTLGSGLMMPLVAIARTYLYGDAVTASSTPVGAEPELRPDPAPA